MELIEYQIYQNHVLGAHALWEFTKSFNDNSVPYKYPTIYQAMPVLPLCLNKRVVEGIKYRNFKEGSLLRAIEENKDLFSGLQERMMDMAKLTFHSLYLATNSRLLVLDREQMVLIPNQITSPQKSIAQLQEDYKDILKASRRIGSWFSKLSLQELLMYFNITL
jgi:hypothetical protein